MRSAQNIMMVTPYQNAAREAEESRVTKRKIQNIGDKLNSGEGRENDFYWNQSTGHWWSADEL